MVFPVTQILTVSPTGAYVTHVEQRDTGQYLILESAPPLNNVKVNIAMLDL